MQPKLGSIWRHTNGKFYRVFAISNTSVERVGHPPDVIYQSYNPATGNSGNWWTRPVSDWQRSFTEIDPIVDFKFGPCKVCGKLGSNRDLWTNEGYRCSSRACVPF